MPDKVNILREIENLVDNFKRNETDYCRANSQYNEAQVRSDFIDPFFRALGWDIENTSGLPQHLREVVYEPRVDKETSKKPDYAFRLAGVRKFFVEAKKPSINIERESEPAFQIRRYAWSANLPISVLTNFKYLIIYDCSPPPLETDDYRTCRIKVYSYTEYEQNFEEIYTLLSREAVYTGKFDEKFAEPITKGNNPIDDYFLTQINRWRKKLAEDILEKNPSVDDIELNYLVEVFINRIVFLRICEDREIEKYESLLDVSDDNTRNELIDLFKRADAKYKSGIFDFRNDKLSLKIAISDDILAQIIKDLYYPRSPYVFSVVESNILGKIYEMFLTQRIEISKKKKIEIVNKPEVTHDLGVVTTPHFVVQEIVNRTVKRQCEGHTPEEISGMRFADMACGSGSFLLEAFEFLLDYHMNWYKEKNIYENLYKGEGDFWYLTLKEKKRILLNNIFGVDVDPNATEVTKFSLLIKLIEDETAATINASIKKPGDSALPSLDDNIKRGNSIVDESFFRFKKASELETDELAQLNVFNWKRSFPFVKDSGFDAIIGNPPYTRIQVLKKLSPLELAFYQDHYISAKNNNFDKYYVFIEHALSLINEEGIIGFIVPHKFMKIKAGEGLRGILSKGKNVFEVVHFGKEQLFKPSSTYTCLLFLKKSNVEKFGVELVSNLHNWRYFPDKRTSLEINASELSSAPWLFIGGKLKELINRIDSLPKKLSDIADVYVGLQTSCDEVYIIKPLSERRSTVTFRDKTGRLKTIEKDLLKPSIYDLTIQPYMSPKQNSYIIFPYHLENGKLQAYSEEELSRYPLIYRYLLSHKPQLIKRNVSKPEEDKWFKYGRSQSLTKFDGREKLIVKVLSLEPCFMYDNQNLHFTGGGNGPYYGVTIKPSETISIFFLQGILNSKLMDMFVKNWSSIFRGGYYSYGKQFIDKLPIVDVDLTNPSQKSIHDSIVRIVKRLIQLTALLESATIPSRKEQASLEISALNEELNETIYNLYGLSDDEKQYLRALDLSGEI